ncbi:MAG: rod shape-determining protein MreC [Eubacteriales bacterium]|nr:rod shape-determining protein MreC [Clostridiales bacterium]MDD7595041.1 rod shape-determining protein MreC [Clostridiales bacterium]MDY5860661.1 rod shape-determining protein MreC [Eubacteriales bacterium]HCG67165.1 rod shape-determining protein MreC [Clostridiales bacterium]
MKFFKNKFFIITLVVALLLSIVPTVLCAMGQGSYVRKALQTAAQPFSWAFTKIGEGLSGFSVYFQKLSDLQKENEELRAQLDDYRDRIYNAKMLEEENKWLSDYLGLKKEHSDFLFEEASVIGRESGNYSTVYTLSKGTMHDIKVNMPVITEDGVVGYVTEVGPTWCRAVSIIETASAVGAYIERSGELGLIEGSYELRFEGKCRMIRLPADADVHEGDRVLTSGLGSIYPRGLFVGEVVSVDADPYSRTLTAVVQPKVDYSSLVKVMIIKDYTIYSE